MGITRWWRFLWQPRGEEQTNNWCHLTSNGNRLISSMLIGRVVGGSGIRSAKWIVNFGDDNPIKPAYHVRDACVLADRGWRWCVTLVSIRRTSSNGKPNDSEFLSVPIHIRLSQGNGKLIDKYQRQASGDQGSHRWVVKVAVPARCTLVSPR